MDKHNIYWAIFQGAVMMPCTIRKTQKQCLIEYVSARSRLDLIGRENCKKVIVTQFNKLTNQESKQ